jgi:hypothetical protein
MASRPIIAAVHGILTRQAVASWPDLLHAWCRGQGIAADVIKKEYVALPLPSFNVFAKNRLLARGLAAEIEAMVRLDPEELISPIHFISHSNGTDIVLKAIKRLAKRGIRTESAVFIGSVLRSDIQRNGVAKLIGEGMLGRAFAYCSRSDMALAVPRLLPWCAYGHLGISGWTLAGQELPKLDGRDSSVMGLRLQDAQPDVVTRRFDRYGHGDYFAGELIHATFRRALADMSLQTATTPTTRTEGRGDV